MYVCEYGGRCITPPCIQYLILHLTEPNSSQQAYVLGIVQHGTPYPVSRIPYPTPLNPPPPPGISSLPLRLNTVEPGDRTPAVHPIHLNNDDDNNNNNNHIQQLISQKTQIPIGQRRRDPEHPARTTTQETKKTNIRKISQKEEDYPPTKPAPSHGIGSCPLPKKK
ncbi:uncharacterized protein BO97DRAFT_72676 [Aspergillus homomorphus CBS 101889]|uniref:Uncharacterized protein n=1 Tax=Aspergillus homomorphus (strain CBS 101889) TaxID=1450537 RepID=A0A395IC58_ASPHC|nr:hypothetical protein BO97DRAFT_72676 [Aspergillus homomorphus CBS 101889]RAL16678.1 hypothetical protein BO97DRAFT_72676 [Aspergillus homomorphus CBS 101889]